MRHSSLRTLALLLTLTLLAQLFPLSALADAPSFSNLYDACDYLRTCMDARMTQIELFLDENACARWETGEVREALADTIEKLAAMHPAARSLALVPVGLTDHREGLCTLHKYTPEEARGVLDIAERWRERLLKKLGTRFVFPSDEFYLAAGRPLPEDGEYEDYEQIDDGVGMLRLLETEFSEAYADLPEEQKQPGGGQKLLAACGVSAAPFLRQMFAAHPLTGLTVDVRALENGFFGPSVTVSGLLTGGDLVRGLQGAECAAVLISACMLRDGETVFLDDMTLEEVSRALKKPVIPVGRRGDEVLSAILEASTWQGRW